MSEEQQQTLVERPEVPSQGHDSGRNGQATSAQPRHRTTLRDVPGRPKASLLTWIASTVPLIAWCVFTGVTAVTIDPSGTNSHWMWLAGLLTASGGGLIGVTMSRIGPRT